MTIDPPANDLDYLVPKNQYDLPTAVAAINAGYPAVAPILGKLMEWLQDYNRPVARVLAPFLRSIGPPLVPHIWQVLRTDDDVWKHWVILILIRPLLESEAAEFRAELERMAFKPRPDELIGKLPETAKSTLEYFGWYQRIWTPIEILRRYTAGERFFCGNTIASSPGSTDPGFRGANLSGADFSKCVIVADFTGADLRRAIFKANVKTCSFDGANLQDADFTGAAIDGATFVGADMTGANFEGATALGYTFARGELPNR